MQAPVSSPPFCSVASWPRQTALWHGGFPDPACATLALKTTPVVIPLASVRARTVKDRILRQYKAEFKPDQVEELKRGRPNPSEKEKQRRHTGGPGPCASAMPEIDQRKHGEDGGHHQAKRAF
jgi:hypothetical protein